jgi:hypothetical protein
MKKQLALLAEDPRHLSLQTKPLHGAIDFYEAQVDIDYRLTNEQDAGDTLVLRVVAKHEIVL